MLQETRNKKELYSHFAHHIAGTPCRFNPRQKARAKLRMEQVLVDVEFEENYFTPPVNYNQASEFIVIAIINFANTLHDQYQTILVNSTFMIILPTHLPYCTIECPYTSPSC